VPVNAKMPEVWENRVQAAGERSNMTLVEAAHHFDVAILGYSPLLSGALLTDPVGHQVAQHSALQSIQDVGAKLVQVRASLLPVSTIARSTHHLPRIPGPCCLTDRLRGVCACVRVTLEVKIRSLSCRLTACTPRKIAEDWTQRELSR
jgi:hypothetical protein